MTIEMFPNLKTDVAHGVIPLAFCQQWVVDTVLDSLENVSYSNWLENQGLYDDGVPIDDHGNEIYYDHSDEDIYQGSINGIRVKVKGGNIMVLQSPIIVTCKEFEPGVGDLNSLCKDGVKAYGLPDECLEKI